MHHHDDDHHRDDHNHHHHHHEPRPVTFEDCVRFHGHSCPGLASGYRAATAALDALGAARPEDEELVAICETDACSVDAVQVIAGTTAGKGNLIVRDYGKHAFTFYNRKNGKAVRVTFRRRDTAETGDFAALRARVFSGEASEREKEEFHALKHKATLSILHAPDEEILTITEVAMEPPETARLYASVTCDGCGEPVAEARVKVVGGKRYCIPCQRKMGV